MTSFDAKQYLDSFINYEISFNENPQRIFKLDRMKKLLQALGSPEKKIKFIHIAGTKGKGSTCVFSASILREAGYKVGLYTSPHLYDFKERIRILKNGIKRGDVSEGFQGKITDGELTEILEEIRDVLENLRVDPNLGRLSFFEVLTAVAICYFVREKVDFVVLETGLGGRLDATNAVESLICAITPVSLEHTKFLGVTLEAIAKEKSAIIKKENQPVVIAPQAPASEEAIRKRCEEYKAKVLWIGQDTQYKTISQNFDGQIFYLKTPKQEYSDLETKLLGGHQMINAAVSVGIMESLRDLGFAVSMDAIRKGIARAVWPGRFEILRKVPYVILDGAHNPASAQALVKTVQDIFPGQKVILIFGISDDKDQLGITAALNTIAQKVIFTKADHPRACWLSEEELQNLVPGKIIVKKKNVTETFEYISPKLNKTDIVLITGSLFVVAEARGLLEENPVEIKF